MTSNRQQQTAKRKTLGRDWVSKLSSPDKRLFRRTASLIRESDIACGRGFGQSLKNPARKGWIKLNRLIAEHSLEYQASTRRQKGLLVKKVLKLLSSDNIRFVKFTSGKGVEELSEEKALKKIQQTFRDRKGTSTSAEVKQNDEDEAGATTTSPSPMLDMSEESDEDLVGQVLDLEFHF